MRKLILRNFQSPGDIVMLTAAVRDLHRCNPDQFQTDVRTPCSQLWENNPYITRLRENDPGVESIRCEYPLIHRSNTEPWHFIHGFTQFLGDWLKVPIRPTAFKGDIHLTTEEKQWMSQVQEITGEPVPYWIIVAGGKRDFTIKWWDHARFQAVVDHFRGKILFVQVGEKGHEHRPLRDVLDLRGKTDLRQLVRLVYHAQGVLCPVTLMMHLAAAVETKPGKPKNRPCVVVAGGREPSQWETYPHHQYIHTNGMLKCCENGGCWRSRTTALGDRGQNDRKESLCKDVVGGLPRCMDMITAEEVIRRIELYFAGGMIHYLTAEAARIAELAVPSLNWGHDNGEVMVLPPGQQPTVSPEGLPIAPGAQHSVSRKTAYLSYSTDNIGDDMQSLALCRFLGKPDLFINRDSFPDYVRNGPIRLIANGFFTCGPFPPPKNIKTIYVGLCAGSLSDGDDATIEHLRSAAPIGCRDQYSLHWCKKLRIEAYYSSCPSFLFKRTIPYDPAGPVVVVDVDQKLVPHFDKPVTTLSNCVRPEDYPVIATRFQEVEKRLAVYQRASLVITNRLHVATPCLGMGVPLIMVEPDDRTMSFRLTALPRVVRIYKKQHLASVSTKPEDHLYDVTGWKRMVGEQLRKRLNLIRS